MKDDTCKYCHSLLHDTVIECHYCHLLRHMLERDPEAGSRILSSVIKRRKGRTIKEDNTRAIVNFLKRMRISLYGHGYFTDNSDFNDSICSFEEVERRLNK